MLPSIAIFLALATVSQAKVDHLDLGVWAGGQFQAQEPVGGTWTALPRVGVGWANGLGIELEASNAARLVPSSDHTSRGAIPRLVATWQPWPGQRLSPFLALGPGVFIRESSDASNLVFSVDEEGRDLLLGAGGGATLRLLPGVLARSDLRWQSTPGAASATVGRHTWLEWTAGIQLSLPLRQDRDADGILDGADACPDEPEDADAFQDDDGCPEDDNDADGLPDTQDSCPDEPGPASTGGCPREGIHIQPPNAMLWVPHPYCEWASGDGLRDTLQGVPVGQPMVVSAPGYLPAFILRESPLEVALQPAPQQGAIVVVTSPSDTVTIDGTELALGPEGTALINAPEGMVEVRVSGGGREEIWQAAVASGYAIWLRPPAPVPVDILFAQGAATLNARASDTIAAMAQHRGAYRFLLQGGHSPEGDAAANLALANRRASQVRASLLEVGVPDDAIEMGETFAADPTADPTSQRVCRITPIPEEQP